MGYTHYFTPANNISTKQMEDLGIFVEKAINIFEEETGQKIKGPCGDGEPVITTEEVAFNGDDETEMSHETMAIRLDSKWSFCKTARKPYDAVVVATILKAKELGILASWSSDGDEDDLKEAVDFYKQVQDNNGFVPKCLK